MEIIAEIGINHNGDLDIAKKLIDVAKFAGCDYVKFQKRTISQVYTKEELDAPRESPWGTTNGEQKYGLEFDIHEYGEIDSYCKSKGIKWFASPWDSLSVGFLENFDLPFIKIASPSLTDKGILEACKIYKKPVILSTGMSTLEQIDNAVEFLGEDDIYAIMHCTSTYPTRDDEMNMLCIRELMSRYPFTTIGFSNHNPSVVGFPVAVAMGAEIVEFHVTLDKLMYGSDQAASFNPEGLIKAVKYIRTAEKMMGDGVKRVYDSELPIIEKLRNG